MEKSSKVEIRFIMEISNPKSNFQKGELIKLSFGQVLGSTLKCEETRKSQNRACAHVSDSPA